MIKHANLAWYQWVSTRTTASTAANYYVDTFNSYNGANYYAGAQNWPWDRHHRQPVAADLETIEIQRREYAVASDRAWELLKNHLTDEQVAQLEKDQYFDLRSDTGEVYRFQKSGVVERLSWEGKPEFTYCIHPDLAFPMGDQILAKKLLLQHDEDRFLKVANATRLYTPPPKRVITPRNIPRNITDLVPRLRFRAA